MKNVLLWLVMLGGIGVIVASFLCFDLGFTEDRIRYLSMGVFILAYSLFFIDLLVPWVRFDDPAKRTIGSLGIRWTAIFLYAVASICAVLLMNHLEARFSTQCIVHSVLILGLILMMAGVLTTNSVTARVYAEEQAARNELQQLKRAVLQLKTKLMTLNLPAEVKSRIAAWEESLRYIAPSQSAEAHDLEQQLIDKVESLTRMLPNYELNADRVEMTLTTLEELYKIRKTIY